MPELPDAEVFRRNLEPQGLKRPIATSRVHDPRILEGVSAATLQRRLKGRPLTTTRRHGKVVFARIGNDGWLTLHFGMTGSIAVFERGEPLPRHTRLELELEDGGRIAFVDQRIFGRVGWVEDPRVYLHAHALGPDALDEVDPKTFRQRLTTRRGALKSAFMDQSLMAGLGNVYADEVLFHAGLHPKVAISDLDARKIDQLFEQMDEVLHDAIDAKANPEAMPDHWMLPHRGKDGRCPRCGEALERVRVGGRTAWFCPRDQKEPA